MARDDLMGFLLEACKPAQSVTPVTPKKTQGVTAQNTPPPLYTAAFVTPVTPATPKNNESLRTTQNPAPLSVIQRQTITRWLVKIECSPQEITQTLIDCETDPQALAHCLRRAADPAWLFGGADDAPKAVATTVPRSCGTCAKLRQQAMKDPGRFERPAVYWCAEPDRSSPHPIPARKGHNCPSWATRTPQ